MLGKKKTFNALFYFLGKSRKTRKGGVKAEDFQRLEIVHAISEIKKNTMLV